MRLLLVTHAEQRCLQHVQVSAADHVGKELQEEGHQQQADVHAIDIGIGGDHDLVVPQVVHILLDVERRLQQVELLVLIYDLLREAEAVERLAPQRKTACVRTSRLLVIEPDAELPSVMKIIDSSASSFLSVRCILQSRSFLLLSDTFLAVSRAFF